ncbi:hypothetical protein TRV_04086 [Paecilomyces variotii No. 5]|uniref:Tat pathway signal sequence n=1 Tax=Byssochlamys spectabilis (strain No. 5 / NBRC 109023) TaxID=1356009 RepID=V5FWR5_BYSSN|nr:hypothetical protein TRV_04086 [Paecilomyces variotii No. 5]
MAPEYKILSTSESEDEPGNPRSTFVAKERLSLKWIILVCCLLLSNIFTLAAFYTTKVDTLDTVWRPFWWNTEYSSANASEADELWDAILPSHGFVAMDRAWAKENQWPESMYLPSDKSKGVYLLEAYHYLHCLRIVRKTFWEAVEQRPFTHKPGAHMNHCFDALRQYVQCNADNTPLYTFGDFTAGDGQIHKCKDWNQLRDFATENTACYRDSAKAIPLGDHFGFCDDGNDGVIDLP